MEVYLDNSATTRPSPRVVEAVTKAMTEEWYNPSSLYKPALEAEKAMRAAREAVLQAAGAQGQRLVFTSGGTEADNLAILGHLHTVRGGGRVLVTQVEHPAVANCAEAAARLGFTVEQIPVDSRGVTDLSWLQGHLAEDVKLICVMQVNNESGAIQPIAEIAALRNELCPGCAIHVDGVQGFLRVPLDFNRLGIQSYALSGHKIHALKGIGALILRRDHRVQPIVYGGGQEENYRSGTENTPGILALGEAVRDYPADGPAQMMTVKRRLWEGISARIPSALLNGPALDDPACSPHVLNVSLQPVRSQTMLFALEGDGIYVSNGSACSSRKQKVSGILTAMGLSTQRADCSLRLSLCPGITPEQADWAVERMGYHYDLLARYVRR